MMRVNTRPLSRTLTTHAKEERGGSLRSTRETKVKARRIVTSLTIEIKKLIHKIRIEFLIDFRILHLKDRNITKLKMKLVTDQAQARPILSMEMSLDLMT